ncbi:MAG: sulfite exporter TauE/SafE family protein [Anaerolineaceae bacterium]
MIPVEIEILIGLATGLMVGITGASGVLLVVPLLTIVMNVGMHTAVGTSLFVDMITPLVVAFIYFRKGNVNLKAALWLAVGAILGAQAGALVANQVVSNDLLGDGFIIFLFLMAISMWIKSARPAPEITESRLMVMTNKNRLITFGIGILVGITSGLFGAGGGLVFLLVLMIILKYPTRMAIGTSSLIMAMTATSGTIGYALHGNVDYSIGITVAIAAVVSGWLGSHIAQTVSDKLLNRIIGVVFAGIGVMMIFLH